MKKVAILTGGVSGIGLAIKNLFTSKGIEVCDIDILPGGFYQGDIGDKVVLEAFIEKIKIKYGRIDYMVFNAPPKMKGVLDGSYEDFEEAMRVGLTSIYYLTQLTLPLLADNSSLVLISSSRDRMSQKNTESYAAVKGGVVALTHSLAMTLAPKTRVNSISPGWIHTGKETLSREDHEQQPVGRVGRVEDIAEMVYFLCSEKAGFITGENICIDGGMTRQMIYHNEEDWKKESSQDDGK